MSAPERLALARAMYDAFARGDMNAVLGHIDAGIEVHDRPETQMKDAPGSGVYRGYEEMFEGLLGNFSAAFEDLRFEPRKFFDTGEKMLVAIRLTAQGKESHAPVEREIVHVWTYNEDLKAVRLDVFDDWAEALAAAGVDDRPENAETGDKLA